MLRRGFYFNDPATTEIYTLSLHDALPIWDVTRSPYVPRSSIQRVVARRARVVRSPFSPSRKASSTTPAGDRKSTRLNSSHANISYAVFCLKKKTVTLLFFSFAYRYFLTST